MAKVFGEDARSFCAKLDKVLESKDYKDTIGKWLEESKNQALRDFVDKQDETHKVFWAQGRASVFLGLQDFIEYAQQAASSQTKKELAKEEADKLLKKGI